MDADVNETSTKAPDPLDVALGGAIRLRRRSIGLSQDALAEQCGVSFQQIQKYENGANRISFSRLVQISRALECRLADLLDVLDSQVVSSPKLAEVDLLARLRAPGAVELLGAYERMEPEVRNALLGLLRNLTLETPKTAS
jgi:transcriptional regulator with XRE-family HTH domain